MNEQRMIRRRDMLRGITTAGVAATAIAAPLMPTVAHAESPINKRRAMYEPNSAEVQTFYRVNRYPAK